MSHAHFLTEECVFGKSVPTKNNKKKMNRQSSAAGSFAEMKKELLTAIKPVVKGALRGAGGFAGTSLGGAFGGPPGAMAGAAAGRLLASRFSKLIGSGDYATNISDIASNSLVRSSGASEYASFSDSKTSVRLRHREYLQDVFAGGGSTFANTPFQVNPGLSNSFPFLAQLAGNFEEYHMHGLVFEYVSTTSPYNAGSAMGSVVMAMAYNANSPAFTSKPQMENSDFAISARPDKSMIYGVECANNASANYYVRTGATSLPLTTTDIGSFQIATQTPILAGTTLGELWVSYDVELFRPKISPARFGYAHWTYVVPALMPAGLLTTSILGGIAPNSPPNGVQYGSCSTFTVNASGSTISFNGADVGDTFLVTIDLNQSTAIAQSVVATRVNLTAVQVFGDYIFNQISTFSVTGSTASYMVTVSSNATTPTLSLASTQVGVLGGTFDVIIVDVGNGLSTWSVSTDATL